MDSDAAHSSLLERLETPVALCRISTLEVVESNRAFDWYLSGGSVAELLSDGNEAKLRARVNRRGVYRATVAGDSARGVSPRHWVCRRVEDDLMSIEGHDDTRARERDVLIASYTKMIQEKTELAEKERERAERLLLNVLPQRVVEDLRSSGRSRPERYESVSVLFLDFVNFTQMSVSQDPETLFSELNDIYTRFDHITERYGCERIKTMGDAYLAVCGMPTIRKDHAKRLTNAALEYLDCLQERNKTSAIKWQARVGIHSGAAIGGIVGVKKYIYDVFGDAINVAARMEALSEPMRINVSSDTAAQLSGDYKCQSRPPLRVKGKGTMQMYFVDRKD